MCSYQTASLSNGFLEQQHAKAMCFFQRSVDVGCWTVLRNASIEALSFANTDQISRAKLVCIKN
jgi:hypothetical protein